MVVVTSLATITIVPATIAPAVVKLAVVAPAVVCPTTVTLAVIPTSAPTAVAPAIVPPISVAPATSIPILVVRAVTMFCSERVTVPVPGESRLTTCCQKHDAQAKTKPFHKKYSTHLSNSSDDVRRLAVFPLALHICGS